MSDMALFEIGTPPPERTIHASGYTVLDLLLTDGRIVPTVGGSAANVAIGLALMGWRSLISGLLGDDRAGRLIKDQLNEYGVDTSGVHLDPDVSTPVLIYEINQDRHVFKFSCPSCGTKYPKFRPLPVSSAAAAPESAVAYFDRASAYAARVAEIVRARGSAVVFEPGSPGRLALNNRMINICDLYRVSSDLTVAADLDDHVTSIVGLAAKGVKYRVGAGGWRHVGTAVETKPVDSGGAGDWLTVGCVDRLERDRILKPTDHDIAEAVGFGQLLAAEVCRHKGTRGFVDHSDPDRLQELGIRKPANLSRTSVPIEVANCAEWFCPTSN